MKDGPDGEHIEDRMAEEAVQWLRTRDKNKTVFFYELPGNSPCMDHSSKTRAGSNTTDGFIVEKFQSPTYAAMVHSLDEAEGTLPPHWIRKVSLRTPSSSFIPTTEEICTAV